VHASNPQGEEKMAKRKETIVMADDAVCVFLSS
jgi:hypothetical protein